MSEILRSLLLALLALISPWAALGQEAWPPQFPPLRLEPPAQNAPPGKLLEADVLEQGLSLLEERNTNGLGPEAAKARAWAKGKTQVSLLRGPDWALGQADGSTLPLSKGLGLALERLDQYFGMTEATLAKPISHEELKASLLSSEGVAQIRGIFEGMIARHIIVRGKPLVPETGGEATLNSELSLHPMADPLRPVFRRISELREDPQGLGKLHQLEPERMREVDEPGLLKRVLENLPLWEARGSPPKEEREKILRQAVETVLENSAGTFIYDPEAQLAAIVDQEWSGRYVGFWHAHPPHFRAQGWAESEGPSFPDMEVACQTGQNLTIAFHPEGFDAYDLSAMAGGSPDLSKARAVSYRSPEWQRHFREIHRQVAPK